MRRYILHFIAVIAAYIFMGSTWWSAQAQTMAEAAKSSTGHADAEISYKEEVVDKESLDFKYLAIESLPQEEDYGNTPPLEVIAGGLGTKNEIVSMHFVYDDNVLLGGYQDGDDYHTVAGWLMRYEWKYHIEIGMVTGADTVDFEDYDLYLVPYAAYTKYRIQPMVTYELDQLMLNIRINFK